MCVLKPEKGTILIKSRNSIEDRANFVRDLIEIGINHGLQKQEMIEKCMMLEGYGPLLREPFSVPMRMVVEGAGRLHKLMEKML